MVQNGELIRYSATLGKRTEQNPYVAESVAIARALKRLPTDLIGRHITVFTSNQAAILAVSQPQEQSGQTSIGEIYDIVRKLRTRGNLIRIMWVPSQGVFDLSEKTKGTARRATERDRAPQDESYQTKSTVINVAKAEQKAEKSLPEGVGKYSKEIDIALPGKHTRILYDSLKRREACVLWWGATAQNSSLALVRCQVINRRVLLCGLCQGSEYHPRHQEHPQFQGHRQDQDHHTFTSFRQSTTSMIIFVGSTQVTTVHCNTYWYRGKVVLIIHVHPSSFSRSSILVICNQNPNQPKYTTTLSLYP
jgi:hypothetical protein